MHESNSTDDKGSAPGRTGVGRHRAPTGRTGLTGHRRRLLATVVLLALALAGSAATASAQSASAPNLSGTWVLQLDKSDFAGMQAPTSRTDVFDHQEPKLTIKRTVSANGQENSTTLIYGIDSKPYKNMVGPSEVTSTLHWEGSTLVSVSTVPNPQAGDVTITDRYDLSQDGKTLTQKRTFSAQGQELTQTMLLVKQ